MSNDPLLEPICGADGEPGRELALERVIRDTAEPLARRIVARYTSSSGGLTREDGQDVVATIVLSLVRRLRAIAAGDDVIRDFPAYVAMQTYNAVHDHLRRRHPNRTRLKNRVRYVLTDDDRLSLRTSGDGIVAALASWDESASPAASLMLPRDSATASMLRNDRPADAIVEILRVAGRPVLFDALVETLADLWQIADAPAAAAVEPHTDDGLSRLESRDVVRALWREIRILPLPQRKALLLNLRDSETVNVISVLAFSGVATFDEIAGAMGMTAEELGQLWNQLPLPDTTIAGMLGLTRQQVINLRKSARERLARRVFARKR